MSVGDQVNLLISLLALANPLGNLPLFLALTQSEAVARRHRIALVSGLAMFVTLALAYWLGLAVLAAFSISLAAFGLGAGLIILLYGLVMVRAPEALLGYRGGQPGALEQRSPALVPLAIPLLAGPGSIARVMIARYHHTTLAAGLGATLVILVAAAFTVLVLYYADTLNRRVGAAGVSAVSRILGMLLMAVGFMGLAEALQRIWPALAG